MGDSEPVSASLASAVVVGSRNELRRSCVTRFRSPLATSSLARLYLRWSAMNGRRARAHAEADEGEQHAHELHEVDGLGEPHDGEDDDGQSLEQTRDRVCAVSLDPLNELGAQVTGLHRACRE